MPERKLISFYGNCPAQATLTLVSARIGTPASVRRLRASFPAGCMNLMAIRLYASTDDQAPAAGEPSGTSLLADYGHVDYVTGEGEIVDVHHEISLPDAPNWLKIFAVNDDFYQHAVNAQLEILIP